MRTHFRSHCMFPGRPLASQGFYWVGIFQILIGNDDWFIGRVSFFPNSAPTILKNMALFAKGQLLIPVPFDFDVATIVNGGKVRQGYGTIDLIEVQKKWVVNLRAAFETKLFNHVAKKFLSTLKVIDIDKIAQDANVDEIGMGLIQLHHQNFQRVLCDFLSAR